MNVVIKFPTCVTCGTSDPYPCRVCGILTCGECVTYRFDASEHYTGPYCVHEKPEPLESEGWK